MKPLTIRQRSWATNGAIIVALGLAAWLLGFHRIGPACGVFWPASILAGALRDGMMPFVSGRHSLIRREDPKGFWIAFAVIAALGCLPLSALILDIVQPGR